jgi:hypothetical protein
MLKQAAFAAVAAIVLAAQPTWAMQTVGGTTSSNGAPRFADPVNKDKDQDQDQNKNGLHLGPSSTVNTPYGPQNPASPFIQGRSTPEAARGAPTASSIDDPTFGPNGSYTPGLHGNNPRP